MLSSVSSVTITGPSGTVADTQNVERFPMRATFGMMMLVFSTRGLPMRPRLNTFSIPFSKRMTFPWGMFGDSVMLAAGRGLHFLTTTFSSTLTIASVLVRPSMQIRPIPSSSGAHLNTLATTERLPSISMVSPTSVPRAERVAVSMRARPYPASDWL